MMTSDRTPILPGQMTGAEQEAGAGTQAPQPRSPSEKPEATYQGNSTDLSAIGALASSILLLFTCLTCGSGVYCLPVVPLILGLIGLLGAKRSVNEEQTRLFSWIGVGAGGISILLIVAGVIAYLAFVLFVILVSQEPHGF